LRNKKISPSPETARLPVFLKGFLVGFIRIKKPGLNIVKFNPGFLIKLKIIAL
jgi:hypothetical protein